MMFVKWSYFATPKIELLLSVNLLFCTSSRVLDVAQIIWNKPKERYMNDVLNKHGIYSSNKLSQELKLIKTFAF